MKSKREKTRRKADDIHDLIALRERVTDKKIGILLLWLCESFEKA